MNDTNELGESNTPTVSEELGEFAGKSFRECADIIVLDHKDLQFLKAQIDMLCKVHEALIHRVEEDARIDEIEIAESNNVTAGGLHSPSYYAINPDYAYKRKTVLQDTKQTKGKQL